MKGEVRGRIEGIARGIFALLGDGAECFAELLHNVVMIQVPSSRNNNFGRLVVVLVKERDQIFSIETSYGLQAA